MKEMALKIFLENYENKGMCEGLPKFIKKFTKEFKKQGTEKTIEYLPWATVERLFRMQGGMVEVVDWNFRVEFPLIEVDGLTGEVVNTIKTANFIHLKGIWQGEELDEFYPLFDNQTSRVIKTPDSQELNSSRQRGSVRLIARLSGIGLWVFEQQEEEDNEEKVIIVKKEDSPKKEKIEIVKGEIEKEVVEVSKTKKAVAKVEGQKEKDDALVGVLGKEDGVVVEEQEKHEPSFLDMLDGEIVKGKEEPKKSPKVEVQKTFANDSEEHADLLIEVKQYVKTHKDMILEFRNGKGKQVLSDLTYDELKELIGLIKG